MLVLAAAAHRQPALEYHRPFLIDWLKADTLLEEGGVHRTVG